MFKKSMAASGDGHWPLRKVVNALQAKYDGAQLLGEEGPLQVYGVQDNGVNFVVAMMQSAPNSGHVVELGFLARFIGFPVTAALVERINRNLHISVVSLEGADLFLMAGLQVTGAFDQGQFELMLEAWRRDLMVTLHGISDDPPSMADAFPAARMHAARDFATNAAPAPVDDRRVDMLARFMGTTASAKALCDACEGRGKRGFIARTCGDCGGSGFISTRR